MNIKKRPFIFLKYLVVGVAVLLILMVIARKLSTTSEPSLIDSNKSVLQATPTANMQEPIEGNLNGFKLGTYSGCVVHSRINMNTSAMPGALRDKSELVCEKNGEKQTMFEVIDKPGFPDAENSIYRVWKDNEGYKALLVDQNGAGSGEGNGKIILLKDNGYKLLTCFYFQAPEGFSYKYDGAITAKEMTSINNVNVTKQISGSTYCSNFILKNYFN